MSANSNSAPGAQQATSLFGGRSNVREVEELREEIGRLKARIGELDELAHLCPLVRLPNRRSFMRDLERLLARLDRSGGTAAMLFIDVDELKRINDRFGHQAGDAALIKIAELLVASVRASDSVARLSGDEFVILLPDMDELGAWNLALRIVEGALATEFDVGRKNISLSVAVGVALINPGDQPDEVIARADRAMYRIKTRQPLSPAAAR
jgi:diguanylate cyclase (GGDEF)-like protein